MSKRQRWFTFFDKPVPNLILRLAVMFVGLSFVALGVALSRATGLGTSPISCLPATLSFITPITIGTFTFILNILFVLAQIALLRRDFHPLQLLQVLFVFVFALLIDAFVPLCQLIPMDNYPIALMLSLVSSCCTAFGIVLQVNAALIMLPGDGIVLTVSRVFGLDFSKCKITFDSTLVILAVVTSLACLGGLQGVREGTIIAALATGYIMGWFRLALKNFEQFAPTKGHVTLTPKAK